MKKIRPAMTIVICLGIIIILFVLLSPNLSNYSKYRRDWKTFGAFKFLTLNSAVPSKDNKELQDVFHDLDRSLTYNGKKKDCGITGPLRDLCRFKDDYGYHTVNASVKPIAYQKILNKGYLWVEYSREAVGKDGSIKNGAWNILTLIELKFHGNKPEIMRFTETP